MTSYLSVTLLQVAEALRLRLLANVGLVDVEVFTSSLLGQQHTRAVTSQLEREHTILVSDSFTAHREALGSLDRDG